MSLSLYIHPYFSQKQKGSPPDTLLSERRWPVPYGLLCFLDRFSSAPSVSGCPLVSNFLSDLEKIRGEIGVEEYKLLEEHSVMFILMALAVSSETETEGLLKLVKMPYVERENISMVIRDYQRQLVHYYTQEKTKARLLADVNDFLTKLLHRETAVDLLHIVDSYRSIRGYPSYTPRSLLKKLVLLSYHPNYEGVSHRIQQLALPKLSLLPNKPPEKKVPPPYLFHLLDPPPQMDTAPPFVKSFGERLWQMHLYPPESLSRSKRQKAYPHRQLPFRFAPWELLEQVWILQFDNWEQLWAWRGYPRTFEVLRRLLHLRQVDRSHVPPVDEMVFIHISLRR